MISNTDTKVFYNGDGSTDTFGYTFRVDDASHLKAYVDNVLMAYPTDYAVTNVGDDIGGSVIFVTPPPVGTGNVVLFRLQVETQLIQLDEGGIAYRNLERQGLDKLVMLIQERSEQIFRSAKLQPYLDLANLFIPDPGSGQLIGWNAAGTALALYSIASITSNITLFSTAILAAASTATLTHNLGSATAKLISPIANWNAGATYLTAQAANTFSVAFPNPAPGGGGTLTWGAIL